jgi:hypothetical protein
MLKKQSLNSKLWFTLACALTAHAVLAQNSAFTYQGQLQSGGSPANGIYDLRFAIYDAVSGGGMVGSPLTNAAMAVSNGLFTAALDFGTGVFTGADRWLEISARTNSEAGDFRALAPRQAITSTPYAIRALSFDGVIAGNQLSGTYGNAVNFSNAAGAFNGAFTGSGAGLTNLNASQLASGTVADARIPSPITRDTEVMPIVLAADGAASGLDADLLDGLSSAAFALSSHNHDSTYAKQGGNALGATLSLGSTDNQALELKVNNARALRIEPTTTSPNVIGGYAGNVVSNGTRGATIVGGGQAGSVNRVSADFGTVGGGLENTSGEFAATVSGGLRNISSGYYATVVGGGQNLSSGFYSTVAGGFLNTCSGFTAAVPGGDYNSAAGSSSLAAGHRAKANHDGAFVWADSTEADFASTGNNQFLIRAGGGVGIGTSTPATALDVNGTATAAGLVVAGNAGFGTNAPVARLDVNGSGWFRADNGGLASSAGAGVRVQFENATGVGHVFAYNYAAGAASNLVLQAPGGNVGIGITTPTSRLHVNGTVAATAFNTTSDRAAKENFTAIDSREVLEKVAALPIQAWNFRALDDGRHLGPTAQDFKAAFNLGRGDTTIATVDADGVALAAIQGLNQKLEQQNAELRQQLADLQALVRKLAEGGGH